VIDVKVIRSCGVAVRDVYIVHGRSRKISAKMCEYGELNALWELANMVLAATDRPIWVCFCWF